MQLPEMLLSFSASVKEKVTEKRVLPAKSRNDPDNFQNEKNSVVESQIRNMNIAIGSLTFKLAAVCERLNKLDQKLDYSQRR